MNNKLNKEILEQFIQNRLSEPEEKEVRSLLAEGEKNEELRRYFKTKFNGFIDNDLDYPHDVGYILDRVHHKINSERSHLEIKPVNKFLKWYSRAAAILLIPLLIAGSIKLFMDYQETLRLKYEMPLLSKVMAPMGSRVQFTLPDGTTGYLNSGSTLEYHVPFVNSRKVNLLGEAWFDVTHDPNHPFEVSSGSSKIKVLGTQFNCNAIPDDHFMEVILEEGKVEFSTKGLKNNVIMKPDERLILQDNVLNVSEVDASKFTAWKEGKLVFRSDPMKEVIRRMERWYNVDIELKNPELDEYVFRGTFQDDTLEEVLKYLSLTSPIKYKITERQLQKDGTVSKKKVLLYKE
nr:FecR domain-containing protein [uncultured Carboxylicivirga sp.]